MTVCVNRITVGNKTFSLNALIANPNGYLPLMQPHFTAAMFAQKSTENFEQYLKRLFNNLHHRAGFATETVNVNGSSVTRTVTPVVLPSDCNSILSALGIELVKKCPKRSAIMFKHSGNKYRMTNEEMIKLIGSIKSNTKLKSKTHPKISFGVEMEFIGDSSQLGNFNAAMENLVGEDRYSAEMCYNKNKGQKWILGTDGSVHPRGRCGYRGARGFELTSPILNINSKKDMQELKNVTELIKGVLKGVTNVTCGTHVHMSFPVTCASDELITHFARSYKRSEKTLFDRVVPRNRQENHAYYSKSVNLNHIFDRYRKLNFCNVKKDSDNMHLEFRQLDGTLDFDKIASWCKLQKLYIELTLDNWKKPVEEENNIHPVTTIVLDDVIISKATDDSMVEGLMKMSRMVV